MKDGEVIRTECQGRGLFVYRQGKSYQVYDSHCPHQGTDIPEPVSYTHLDVYKRQIDLRVRRGDELYRQIVDEARERKTELIVLRRRGKRGFLANLLVGEMVSKVLALSLIHI